MRTPRREDLRRLGADVLRRDSVQGSIPSSHFKAVFDKFNSGDGTMDLRYMGRFLACMSETWPPADIQLLTYFLDEGNSGAVNFEELAAFWHTSSSATSRHEWFLETVQRANDKSTHGGSNSGSNGSLVPASSRQTSAGSASSIEDVYESPIAPAHATLSLVRTPPDVSTRQEKLLQYHRTSVQSEYSDMPSHRHAPSDGSELSQLSSSTLPVTPNTLAMRRATFGNDSGGKGRSPGVSPENSTESLSRVDEDEEGIKGHKSKRSVSLVEPSSPQDWSSNADARDYKDCRECSKCSALRDELLILKAEREELKRKMQVARGDSHSELRKKSIGYEITLEKLNQTKQENASLQEELKQSHREMKVYRDEIVPHMENQMTELRDMVASLRRKRRGHGSMDTDITNSSSRRSARLRDGAPPVAGEYTEIDSTVAEFVRRMKEGKGDGDLMAIYDCGGTPKVFFGKPPKDDGSSAGGSSCGSDEDDDMPIDVIRGILASMDSGTLSQVVSAALWSHKGRVLNKLHKLTRSEIFEFMWEFTSPIEIRYLQKLVALWVVLCEDVVCEDNCRFVEPGLWSGCKSGCMHSFMSLLDKKVEEQNKPGYDEMSLRNRLKALRGNVKECFCNGVCCGMFHDKSTSDLLKQDTTNYIPSSYRNGSPLMTNYMKKPRRGSAPVTNVSGNYSGDLYASNLARPQVYQDDENDSFFNMRRVQESLQAAESLVAEASTFVDARQKHLDIMALDSTKARMMLYKKTGHLISQLQGRQQELLTQIDHNEQVKGDQIDNVVNKLRDELPKLSSTIARCKHAARPYIRGGHHIKYQDAEDLEDALCDLEAKSGMVLELRDGLNDGTSTVCGSLPVTGVLGSIRKLEFTGDDSEALFKPRDWNADLQNVLEDIERIRLESDDEHIESENPALLHSYNSLYRLAQDFVDTSEMYGKIILAETALPWHAKTILPSDLGGRAGGTKYDHMNILYKFAVDVHGYYDGDEYAMKVAGHDLKGLSAFSRSGVPRLHVPLMAVIDFRGHRLIALSRVPVLGQETLTYGSADGGVVVHTNNAEVYNLMRSACRAINLGEHQVSGKIDGERDTVWGPADIEAHKSTIDGRVYVLDFARVFPPEPPNKSAPGSFMYRLLRPELVKGSNFPLSSDAFSPFASPVDSRHHNTRVEEAYESMRSVLVPRFARWLGSLNLERLSGLSGTLSQLLHREGINIRALGQVEEKLYAIRNDMPQKSRWALIIRKSRKSTAVPSAEYARRLIVIEMTARVVKNELRQRMREVTYAEQSGYGASESVYRATVVNCLNELMSKRGAKIWQAIHVRMERQFTYLRRGIDINAPWLVTGEVVKRAAEMSGIVLTSNARQSLGNTYAHLVESDIREISTRVKHANVVSVAAAKAIHLQMNLFDVDKNRAAGKQVLVQRLAELAIKKYHDAVAQAPDDDQTLQELSNALIAYSKKMLQKSSNAKSNEENENDERARQSLIEAVEVIRMKRDPQAMLRLAEMAARWKKLEPVAILAYKEAIELSPNSEANANIQIRMGEMLLQTDNKDLTSVMGQHWLPWHGDAVKTFIRSRKSQVFSVCGVHLSGDVAASVMEGVQLNKSITSLDVKSCGIKDSGAKALAEVIRGNKTLVSINVSDNGVTGVGGRAIALALQENTKLRLLNISDNTELMLDDMFDGGFLRELSRVLSRAGDSLTHATSALLRGMGGRHNSLSLPPGASKCELQTLVMENVGLGDGDVTTDGEIRSRNTDQDFKYLGELMKPGGSALREIYLGRNKITTSGARILGSCLMQESTVEHLFFPGDLPLKDIRSTSVKDMNLKGRELGPSAIMILCAILEHSDRRHLESLDLSGNLLNDDAMISLSSAFRNNSSIGSVSLNLIENSSLTKTGMWALSKIIKENPKTLETLTVNIELPVGKLVRNNITELNIGMRAVKEADLYLLKSLLKRNKTVKTLKISLAHLGEDRDAVVAINKILKATQVLKNLELRNNDLGDDGVSLIADGLMNNKTLQMLNLHQNSITDQGAGLLAEALLEHESITSIMLQSNEISDVGAAALAKALDKNANIREILLYRNEIADDGAKAIATAVNNRRLRGAQGGQIIRLEMHENKYGALARDNLQRACVKSKVTQLSV